MSSTGVIDVHTHYVPREPSGLPGDEDMPWVRVQSESEAVIMVGSREFRRIRSECWDAEARLADMDADGVDAQVVSPTPVFFSYARDATEGVRIARIFNDLALEICEPAPKRLLPFCQVPLQDTDAACSEVERCMANGHLGVEIGNHVGDRDLDDGGIATFLQHCASIGAPVFVHPWDMASSPRLERWMARWLVGMPAETHLSIMSMVLGGTFDRVGEGLRICFAHGGGSFPFWVGRMDNAWHRRSEALAPSPAGSEAVAPSPANSEAVAPRPANSEAVAPSPAGSAAPASEHPPSHYLGRFYVDSAVFDERALRLLVDTVGVDRVLVGSDYPYALGERPAGAVVQRAGFLTERDRSRMLRLNAEDFLGLSP
jgi:aminocarboxymuconate-semialdehyde decarboxylase